MNKLNIFFDKQIVGSIIFKNNSYFFSYDKIFLDSKLRFPISLSLPLTDTEYSETEFKHFFSNLLPEGEIREIISKIKQVSSKNIFGLLSLIGRECAGALSIIPDNIPVSEYEEYKKISLPQIDYMIENSETKPLIITEEGLRLSLAGAQNKLPVFIKDSEIHIALGNLPTTHIIKPQIKFLQNTVENEYFCINLASLIGLDVNEVDILDTGRNKLLIIKRFDRYFESGKLNRLHQEDFCQALGYFPDNKYESEGGPNLFTCFSLIDKFFSTPVIDKKNLFLWCIFNYLIGNTDGHSKNISILYKSGKVALSPFYDLLSTIVYPDLTKNMAFKIGNEKRHKWIRRRHFIELGKNIGIKQKYINFLIDQLINKVNLNLPKLFNDFVEKFGKVKIIEDINEIILKNIKNLKENI